VTWAVREKSYSQRRACGLVGLHSRTYRYRSKRPGDDDLRKRLRELASQRRRFGYRRLPNGLFNLVFETDGSTKACRLVWRNERLMGVEFFN
jgi:hypothetical protein